jgi:uncharacterized protein (DUF169 family)
MPFTVNQVLCAKCGSCIGNCPNKAIIRIRDTTTITSLCFDCGVCIKYCPAGAIGQGPEKTEKDHKKLNKALKEKLGLKKNIAAMKYMDNPPEGIRVEEGPHFWCGLCGDVFDGETEPVYFTKEASTCGGSANIALGAMKAPKEMFEAAMDASVIGEGKSYLCKDLLAVNRNLFPQFKKIYKGVVIGSLESVPNPDLIIFPINGHQLGMVATAYGFETGLVLKGYAGKAACLNTIPFPLAENTPVFSPGDHGGRTFMRLENSEILTSFPFKLVPGLAFNLDRTIFAQE